MKKGPGKAGAVTRQSGGMRQSFGGMSGLDSEKMEQQAMGGAMQQKTAQQQAGATPTQSAQAQSSLAQQQGQPPPPPRELSSISEELLKRPVKDVWGGLRSLFDLNTLLEINPGDTPEEQARKKQLHQRFQQLTEAEQQEAKKRYQQELQRKQAAEKEKQEKEQQRQQQAQAGALPSVGKTSKRGTALMGGSQKKKAAARLAHDRQTIGKVAGAN